MPVTSLSSYLPADLARITPPGIVTALALLGCCRVIDRWAGQHTKPVLGKSIQRHARPTKSNYESQKTEFMSRMEQNLSKGALVDPAEQEMYDILKELKEIDEELTKYETEIKKTDPDFDRSEHVEEESKAEAPADTTEEEKTTVINDKEDEEANENLRQRKAFPADDVNLLKSAYVHSDFGRKFREFHKKRE